MARVLSCYLPRYFEDAGRILFEPISIVDLAFLLQDRYLVEEDWYRMLLKKLAIHYDLQFLPIVSDQSGESFFYGPDFKQRSKMAMQLYFTRRNITNTIPNWEYEEPHNKLLTISQVEGLPELERPAKELWSLLEEHASQGAKLLPSIDRMLLQVWGVDEKIINQEGLYMSDLLPDDVIQRQLEEVFANPS